MRSAPNRRSSQPDFEKVRRLLQKVDANAFLDAINAAPAIKADKRPKSATIELSPEEHCAAT